MCALIKLVEEAVKLAEACASPQAYQNDVIILLDFLHKFFEALLKLSPVLGTGHKETHVQGDHLNTMHIQVSELS